MKNEKVSRAIRALQVRFTRRRKVIHHLEMQIFVPVRYVLIRT